MSRNFSSIFGVWYNQLDFYLVYKAEGVPSCLGCQTRDDVHDD